MSEGMTPANRLHQQRLQHLRSTMLVAQNSTQEMVHLLEAVDERFSSLDRLNRAMREKSHGLKDTSDRCASAVPRYAHALQHPERPGGDGVYSGQVQSRG